MSLQTTNPPSCLKGPSHQILDFMFGSIKLCKSLSMTVHGFVTIFFLTFVGILKDIFLNSFVKELTNFANFPWKPSVLEAQVSYKRIPKAATPSRSTYNNRFLKATKNIKKKSA